MAPNIHLSCNLSPSRSTVPRRNRSHDSPPTRMGRSRLSGPQHLAVGWLPMKTQNLHLTKPPTLRKWEAGSAGSSSCKLTQRGVLAFPAFGTHVNITADYYSHSYHTLRSERTTTIRHMVLQARISSREFLPSLGSFQQPILTLISSRHRDFWREVPYMLRDVLDHLCASFRPKHSGRGGYISV